MNEDLRVKSVQVLQNNFIIDFRTKVKFPYTFIFKIQYFRSCFLESLGRDCIVVNVFMQNHLCDIQQFVISLCLLFNRYSHVGRSFDSPDIGLRQPLGESLESQRGFYESIRPTHIGLWLSICLCSLFCISLPVFEFFYIVYMAR